MSLIRRDPTEGLQHKFSLVHLDMGDAQIVILQDQIVIKNDIQIQGAGTPADDPLSSRFLLDPVQFVQEFVRIQKSLHFQASVQEVRLIRHPVRRRLDEIRDLFHPKNRKSLHFSEKDKISYKN